jgi:hypothetical protein
MNMQGEHIRAHQKLLSFLGGSDILFMSVDPAQFKLIAYLKNQFLFIIKLLP